MCDHRKHYSTKLLLPRAKMFLKTGLLQASKRNPKFSAGPCLACSNLSSCKDIRKVVGLLSWAVLPFPSIIAPAPAPSPGTPPTSQEQSQQLLLFRPHSPCWNILVVHSVFLTGTDTPHSSSREKWGKANGSIPKPTCRTILCWKPEEDLHILSGPYQFLLYSSHLLTCACLFCTWGKDTSTPLKGTHKVTKRTLSALSISSVSVMCLQTFCSAKGQNLVSQVIWKELPVMGFVSFAQAFVNC